MLICKLCGKPMRMVTQGRGFQTFGCSKGCPDSYISLETYEIKSAAQAAARTQNSSRANSQAEPIDSALTAVV